MSESKNPKLSNFDPHAWLGSISTHTELGHQCESVIHLPPRSAKFAEPQVPLSPGMRAHLEKRGLFPLFSHQAQALDSVAAGKPTLVVTGTNSGKSLCYALPAIQAAIKEPMARSMLIFPTKALARDQAEKLEKLKPDSSIKIGVYDGDTPRHQRTAIRKACHILITNPDMLHVGILPQHEHWAPFFKSMRILGLDELHTYRGVFGSHMAGVVRRLLNLCEWHKSHPIIIGGSATIANPASHFELLTGQTPHVIDGDGSPQGGKDVILWNPKPIGGGQRAPANQTTAAVLASLLEAGLTTLSFSRSRPAAEQVLKLARIALAEKGLEGDIVDSYRAGYTAKERRDIENKMFSGQLQGLSSTNALELGVDIGGLDAVIINGFPGTLSSFWQQAGRAGRSGNQGIAVYVAHSDAMEQFLLNHPQVLMDSRLEPALIDLENPHITSAQVECASYERGLSLTDLDRFGPQALKAAEALEQAGNLGFGGGRFFYRGFDSPALRHSLRGIDSHAITLRCEGQAMGEIEHWRACRYAHPGAIYLHRGATFRVDSLDFLAAEANLVPCQADYITFPVLQTSIRSEAVIETVSDSACELLAATVTQRVVGYQKKNVQTGAPMGQEELDLPDETFSTIAVRFGYPEPEPSGAGEFAAGLHGTEHALMATAPLLAGCDRLDLGSHWEIQSAETGNPVLWVYDLAEGGIGLSARLYAVRNEWVRRATQLLSDCTCTAGCPDCLYDSRCIHGNSLLDKSRAIEILQNMATKME